ncbi:MAG: SUMF1/EgtB/PvdO family nonheme iron enzyme [Rhodomicrobium sp.]
MRAAVRIFLALCMAAFAGHAACAKRLALVIGVNKYPNLAAHAQLQRAVNDARAVAKAFGELGFEVIALEDAGRARFNEEWQQFLSKTGDGDAVAFYFAGHGVEIEGLNFLIPGDIPLIQYGRQEQIKRESIAVSELLLDLRKRRPSVVLLILDACRDHPLVPEEYRSAGAAPGGLARIDAPEGTFIMYSAGAGQTALDRLPQNDPDGVNSIYTRKLLPLMRKKGLQLRDLAAEVRGEVHALAATVPHSQTPAYYDGVLGTFCLAGCETGEPEATTSAGGASVVTKKAGKLAEQPAAGQIAAAPPSAPAPADGWRDGRPVITPGLGKVENGLPYPFGGASAQVAQAPECDGLLIAVATGAKSCVKPGSGESFKDCPHCPEMVVVPSGSFTMGSPENEPEREKDEGPQHKVTITEPFAVGRFAVTLAEWDACAQDGGCGGYKPSDQGWGRGKMPVINVSWNDAQAYVKWLSEKTGRQYRLLSEAEREYVTRAGTKTPFWWGSSITPEQANYNGNYNYNGGSTGKYRKRTLPINSFDPNPWGLYQVHGNVCEWVEDCWHSNYEDAPSDGSVWITGNCVIRVHRGSSWGDGPQYLRAEHRGGNYPYDRYYLTGFRVALGWQDLNR